MAEPGYPGDNSPISVDIATGLAETDSYLSQSTELLSKFATTAEDRIQFSRFLKEVAQSDQEMTAVPIGFIRDNRSINYVETQGKDRLKFRLPYPSNEELNELIDSIEQSCQTKTEVILTPEYSLFADPDQGSPISLADGEISSAGPIEETINKIRSISEISGKIIVIGSICEQLTLSSGKKVACTTALIIHPDGRIIPRRKIPSLDADLFEFDEDESAWKKLNLRPELLKAIETKQIAKSSDNEISDSLEISELIANTIRPIRKNDDNQIGMVVCWERGHGDIYKDQLSGTVLNTWLCPMSEGTPNVDEQDKPIKTKRDESRITLFFEAQNIYKHVTNQREALNQPPTTEDTTICITNEKRGRGATVVFNPHGEVVRAVIL